MFVIMPPIFLWITVGGHPGRRELMEISHRRNVSEMRAEKPVEALEAALPSMRRRFGTGHGPSIGLERSGEQLGFTTNRAIALAIYNLLQQIGEGGWRDCLYAQQRGDGRRAGRPQDY